METILYVSEARFQELPEPLQTGVRWPALSELRNWFGWRYQKNPSRPPLDEMEAEEAVENVRKFVSQDFLPSDPLRDLFLDPKGADPEVHHSGIGWTVRARQYDVILSHSSPKCDDLLAEAGKLLTIPLRSLKKVDDRRFSDGAYVQLHCPPEGGFLGGRCPYLWIYEDRDILVCSFEVPVSMDVPDVSS